MSHDIVITGGTIVDGTGTEPYTGDVAIDGDRIVAVGKVDEGAKRTIDAAGAIVTPGFVDIHAHYDGQATWDTLMAPSSWHGVTTVIMGNCGVGFAPCRPADHDRLIELMEGVEDIPGAALHEGLDWQWESFPQYLDALDRRHRDIDVGAQLPHGAVRLFVMGERGAKREDATADDIVAMGRIAAEAMEAGAIGFATSRTRNHRSSNGELTPTLTATADELAGIASAMNGKGVLQVVSDFFDIDDEMDTILGMAEVSGRPLSISIAQNNRTPESYRALLAKISDANARGLQVKGQVAARAIGILLGHQATMSPLNASPTARRLAGKPFAERLAAYRDPTVRQTIIDELGTHDNRWSWDRMFPLADPPDYEPGPDKSVAALAAKAGVTPQAFVYDHLMEAGGTALLYVPVLNYAEGNLDAVREMLDHEHTVVGLADGGAHVGTICDASFPTTLLTHWARDRERGERLGLSRLIAKQTSRTADVVGLADRGTLKPGLRADVNVIDLDGLTLHPPMLQFDLPAGGKRLLQRADGYLHTLVAGQETYANGEHTGALPGRLVRGAQR